MNREVDNRFRWKKLHRTLWNEWKEIIFFNKNSINFLLQIELLTIAGLWAYWTHSYFNSINEHDNKMSRVKIVFMPGTYKTFIQDRSLLSIAP